MNQVVIFLGSLTVTEENGGVKRMLGVCSEFERIARVVLEKSDKEIHSRRKRRAVGDEDKELPQNPQRQVPQKRAAPPTPQSNDPQTPQNFFTPNFSGDIGTPAFTPTLQNFPPDLSNMNLPVDFSDTNLSNLMAPSSGIEDYTNAGTQGQQYSNGPLNPASFQQPFVPQDLWQMPMTLEWDWADIGSSNGFPAGYDPGLAPPPTQDPQQQQQNGGGGHGQRPL